MVVAYHHFSLMSKIGASKSETGDNLSSAIKMCERSEQHNNFKLSHFTEKVSFNIASEASYVYILRGQKLIKNAKNGPFRRVFENLNLAVKQCYQTGQF